MPMKVKYKSNIKAVTAAEKQGAVKGLRHAVEHLLQVSRTLVPVEETTLERSGTPSVDEASLTGAVSYDTPYAVRQHEEMDWRHDEGRQAKYLEQPMTTEANVMNDLIAAQVRRALQ